MPDKFTRAAEFMLAEQVHRGSYNGEKRGQVLRQWTRNAEPPPP